MSGSKGKVLLDSNIVIYLSQKKLTVDEVFDEEKSYCISLITYMEILSYHFQSQEEEEFVRKLLLLFEVVEIDKHVADKVIQLKKSRKIKLPDAIIVATAMIENALLCTNDKQLHTIEGLNIRCFDGSF
jgi:predicted nucleic acid-binding protein